MTSSASTSPQRVLVIGYGNAGSHILRALAARPSLFLPSLLVRPSSLSSKASALDPFRALGVPIIPGDITTDDEATLVELLLGFDVVIVAVSPQAIPAQVALAKAAVTAGVRRFVPCEFGIDVGRIGRGNSGELSAMIDGKIDVREKIIASGVPYTLIQCSVWTELLLSPFTGVIDLTGRVVTMAGSAEVRLSTTTHEDLGTLTAAIINDPSTINADVHVASQTLTLGELADAVERATGVAWTRRVRSVEEMNAAVEKNGKDMSAVFKAMLAKGVGFSWSEEETWNRKRPELRLTTVEAFVRQKEAERKAAAK